MSGRGSLSRNRAEPGPTAASNEDKTIVIAAAIDDSYTNPLLVALWSACRALSPGWSLHVFVIGYHVSEASKRRLEASLKNLPISLEWTTLDLSGPRSFWPGITHDAEITAYYRLFLGDVLPQTVERVLFLDADVLVEGDLADLWTSPFEGRILQAVPDAYGGLLHVPRLKKSGLAFHEGDLFFNAGVLLIDLRRWRQEAIGQKASALLWKHGSELYGRDQDALNTVLAGRWKPLPPRWNLHELPHFLFCWETKGLSRRELRRAFASPGIVHFVGGWKPWSANACQSFYKRWQERSREVGVAIKPFPLLKRLRQKLILAPHAELNQRFWRDVVQAPDSSRWLAIVALLLKHPWMLLTYPLWQAGAWCQYARIRIALYQPEQPARATAPEAAVR